jgi:hypothetical protein
MIKEAQAARVSRCSKIGTDDVDNKLMLPLDLSVPSDDVILHR